MGEEFTSQTPPALEVKVIGARALAMVEILKDSAVAGTLPTKAETAEGTWTDPKPTMGVHYYYVRVEQTDGQLAWSSPLWVDYRR